MTTDTLRAAAQKLVALRQASGIECPISDVSDVYDATEAAAWDKLNAALAAPVQEPAMTDAANLIGSMWDEFKASHPSYRTSYEEGYLDGLDAAEQRLRGQIAARPQAGQAGQGDNHD